MPQSAAKELARTLGMITAILNDGVKEGIFDVENPMMVQMMIVSSLITHQTTQSLRQRVTRYVKGSYRLLPEPNMEDFAKMLASSVVKMVRKEKSL
jgi:hypothetical protein